MTRKSYLIAAAAVLAAFPLAAGETLAQRASKPGAVENQDSSTPAARSLKPGAPAQSSKSETPAKDKGEKKGEVKGEKKGEEKKK